MPRELIAGMPEDLQILLRDYELEENIIGCSSATVLHLLNSAKGNAYLKIAGSAEIDGLAREAAVLKWLRGRLPVPRVQYFAEHEDRNYLIISEIPGDTADLYFDSPKEIIGIWAAGLRLIHGLDIVNCPLWQTLDLKIPKAELRVRNGLVNEENFEAQYAGISADELLTMLMANIPACEDKVFTHGDYCPENIIVQDGKLSGFIDWGRAGVADRYQDIALAVRSIRHTWNREDLEKLFMDSYGIEDADYSKIEFYILLDEFF